MVVVTEGNLRHSGITSDFIELRDSNASDSNIADILFYVQAANVLIKFGWTAMKLVGEIALRNLKLHMVLC